MNILDYLATEFATFEEKPFGPIDSLILSQFCMIKMEDIAPPCRSWNTPPSLRSSMKNRFHTTRDIHFHDALRAELYDDLFSGFMPDLLKQTIIALAASPRFRAMKIQDCASVFDEEKHIQFAAMTFVYKKEFAYIGFRGTDRSFTGWREDFNMTYTAPIPSQSLAVQYLNAVAPTLPHRLFVGGHSKGGNLAEYAALCAKPATQDHLERIFDHDGPGFQSGLIDPKSYARICDRVHKTVPQESIVGMFLETPEDLPLHVVKSSEHGMAQHVVFNWKINGDDFLYADSLSEIALSAHAIVEQWLAEYSPEEKRQIVDEAFEAIESSKALDAADLLTNGIRSITLLLEAAKSLDDEERDLLVSALKTLLDIVRQDARRGIISRFKLFSPKTKEESNQDDALLQLPS